MKSANSRVLLFLACYQLLFLVQPFTPLLVRHHTKSRRLETTGTSSTPTTSLLLPLCASAIPIDDDTKKKKKGSPKRRGRKRKSTSEVYKVTKKKNPNALETWRLYGISVHPDDLQNDDDGDPSFPTALEETLKKKLKCDELPPNTKVVRRSLDARKKLDHPTFVYVVDVTVKVSQAQKLGWRVQPGRLELLNNDESARVRESTATTSLEGSSDFDDDSDNKRAKKTVVVVGAGPAGLFCALQLALKGVKPILMDRGQPVEKRGRDIGALIHRRSLNRESNFAFGEGGAGTWSDGKLTTRIGRNSDQVRLVLETFVQFGAPEKILWEGAPHLGTDNLVRLLRNMRSHLQELGGEIHFGTKMTDLIIEDGVAKGVKVQDNDGGEKIVWGDAVVLATGHSARDVYESLHDAGVQLEAKGFACGFRIEHPQKIINQIQYGDEWGACVKTGKGQTDATNRDYFEAEPKHVGNLPVASYRLATDQADDGTGNHRGVYSFCMCPGGQIVPSSTDEKEVCVNGMSFSKRDSIWANSALVVTVAPDDDILQEYRKQHGILAGLEFQRDMERRACEFGGGNWTVPVQRVTDFVNDIVSETIPSSSYRLGVKSAPCHLLYPSPITTALKDALVNHFSKQMPGYYHPDALLHAVETRTSSPLRVSRNPETLQAFGTVNLFPAGEGAGFAGGIVSAAVDGITVSDAVLDLLRGTSGMSGRKIKSIGFSY